MAIDRSLACCVRWGHLCKTGQATQATRTNTLNLSTHAATMPIQPMSRQHQPHPTRTNFICLTIPSPNPTPRHHTMSVPILPSPKWQLNPIPTTINIVETSTSPSAPSMSITSVADVNGLLLHAVAPLCSRWAGVDRVSVVYAAADGEALDDLDAHCWCVVVVRS